MKFKRAIIQSFFIALISVSLPYLIGYLTHEPHVNHAKLNVFFQFLLIWLLLSPLMFVLERIWSLWANLYDAHYHNRMNGHDSYGEILHAGDIVEVEAVTSSGIVRGESVIVMHEGYLKCKCHHGLMRLSFYHSKGSLIKIKKVKNKK